MNFDDPALKSAVRRVWGRQTAPPGLRAQIEQLIRAERQAAGAVPIAVPRRRRREGALPLAPIALAQAAAGQAELPESAASLLCEPTPFRPDGLSPTMSA